jgi:hypothetical protein
MATIGLEAKVNWWANCLTCRVIKVVDPTEEGKQQLTRFMKEHEPVNHAVECFVGDEPCPFCKAE